MYLNNNGIKIYCDTSCNSRYLNNSYFLTYNIPKTEIDKSILICQKKIEHY